MATTMILKGSLGPNNNYKKSLPGTLKPLKNIMNVRCVVHVCCKFVGGRLG